MIIGPAMAKRIVAAFGEATFDIIEATPDRLKEVSGIGPLRASRITAGWAEQKAVRESPRALRAALLFGRSAAASSPFRAAR